VDAGTFSENIIVNKSLSLRGANVGVKATGTSRGAGETLINGTGASSTFLVTIEANDVTLDGFKVEIRNSARDGINTRTGSPVSPATSASRSGITLRNNWIYADLPARTNSFNGIVFGEHVSNTAQAFSAEISQVTIEDNYIDLTSTSSNATPESTSITGARGIVFTNMFRNSGASLTYSNLVVDDNTVYATYNTIIQAQLQTQMVGAKFTNNTIGNSRSGPNLPTLISGSEFKNNTIQNINPGSDYYSNLTGAYLGVVNSTVSGNKFSNIAGTACLVIAGGRAADATYFPPSSNSTISNNTFTYNDVALSSLAGYTSALLVEPNTISAAVNVGGWLTGRQAGTTGADASSLTFSNNSLTNGGFNSSATTYAITQQSAGETLSASCNWFGTATPSALSTQLNGSISASPFLISGADSDVAASGFQPASGTCTGAAPVTNITNSTSHFTIQAAIDAASSGDIIQVAAGTYAENISLNKSVELRGPNHAISPNTGSRLPEAILIPASTNTSTGAVITISVSNASFTGFTVNGDNPDLASSGVGLGGSLGTSIDAARAVFLQGNGLSNVTIADNIARNVVNGIRIEQTTNYFASTAGALRSTNILIDDNRVENTTGTGIRLGNSMYAKVTNNTVSNADTGIAFSSFRISDSGNAADRVVANNTITARYAGIWTNLFHASPYAITNNTIQVAPAATAMAPTPQNRTAWFGMMYSTVSCPQNFTNQVSLPLVATPEYWTASGNVIDGAGLESTSTGHGYWLYYVDNNRDANGTDHFGQISGGSVSNVLHGALLKNRDAHLATNFGTAAVGAHAELGNITFNLLAGGTGIHVVDSAAWITSNPAPLVNKRDVKVKLGSGVVFNGGANGIYLSHPVAGTANYTAYASLVGGSAENAAFSGQTTSYIELVNHSADILATNASFEGALGSAKSDEDLFNIERKIVHKLDNAVLGRVTVKANHLHVTSDNSITDAITASAASNTISVEAGTYAENLTINTANLTVRAVGDVTLNDVADPAAWSGWSGANMPGRAPMVWLKANGITFEGFKLRDYKQKSGSPYLFSVVRVEADDVTVKGLNMQSQYDANYLASASYELIVVAKGNNVRIENNTLSRTKQNTLGTAILKVERVIAPGDLVGNVLLKDNIVSGGPVAVRLNPNATITVQGNSIADVNFEGLWVALESGASSSGHLVFTGNAVSNYNVTCGTCKGMKITAKPASINSQTNSAAMRTALETANPSVPNWQLDWMGPVYNVTQDTFASTIQAAINAASAGDVIEVAAGTYNEALTINKQLDIRGAGATTILQNTGGTVVTLQAAGSGASASSRTALRDLTISGSTKGVYAQDLVNHVTFEGVTISGNSSYGVHVNNTSGTMQDWAFEDCTFDGNSSGVYVSMAANLNGLSITGSTFSNHTNTAFYVGQSSSTPGGLSNVTLTGNTFTGNGPSNNQAALYIEKLSNATISGNTFTNNGLNLNPRGIIINLKYGNYSGITVSGNTFVENRGASQTGGYGINIQARNDASSYNTFPATLGSVSVTGNAITGFYRGITLENAVDWNTASVSNNALTNCPIGILGVVYGTGNTANASTSLDVNNNSIVGSTVVAIGNWNTNGGLIDATCNWFGSDANPSASIQGTVSFLPWLTSGTDSDVAAGFQPAAGTCVGGPVQVFDNSADTTPNSGHATIQAAIDAASTVAGNEVRVAAGTYTENLTLNKRLTLRGAGSGADPATNTVLTSAAANTPVVVLNAAGLNATDRLVLRDLHITGATGTAGNSSSGIYAYAQTSPATPVPSFVTIDNVNLANNAGYGIVLNSQTVGTDWQDWKVLNSTFNGNNIGLRIAGNTDLDGLLVNNCAFTSNTQFGVQSNATEPTPPAFNSSTNWTLSNSTFTGNGTAGPTTSGRVGNASILGFNGNLSVSDVTIDGLSVGADHGFSITGRAALAGANPAIPAVAAGTMSFTNLTIQGNFRRPGNATTNAAGQGRAFSIKNYSDVSAITFSNVNLLNGEGNSLEAMGLGSTLNLGDTEFGAPTASLLGTATAPSGENDGTRKMYSIVARATNSNPAGKSHIDATSATFAGLSNSTLTGAFGIADRIFDAVDDASRGLVSFKANEVFVTPTSFDLATTTPSVQRAIDAATAGNTVHVAAGTYTEAVNVNKSVALRGANYGVSGCDNRLAESSIVSAAGTAVTIGANGASLDGFRLSGVTGVASTGYSASLLNNKVEAVALGLNIAAVSAGYTVTGNCISNSTQVAGSTPTAGIVLAGVSGTAPAVLSNNELSGGFYGHLLYAVNSSTRSSINGGEISGVMQGISVINVDPSTGTVYAPTAMNISGIEMSGFAGAHPALASSDFHAGVYAFTGGSNSAAAVNLALENVTIRETGKPRQNSAALYFADFSTVSGSAMQTVTVNNSSLRNNKNRAINTSGKNALVTVTNSVLENNGFDAFGGANVGYTAFAFTGSTINLNNNFITLPASVSNGVAAYALGAWDDAADNIPAASITANNNTFNLNGLTTGGLINNSGLIDATCNWWGADANPSASIQGTVSFLPWLISGTDSDGGAAGFQPAAGTCVGGPVQVFENSADTTPNSGHATIQAAIDAATTVAGNEVRVAAGTYNEAVYIHKGVTVKSTAGAATTTIAGAATDANGPWAVRFGANNVRLEGFTVSNLDAANGRAIAPAGFSGGTIVNNTIVSAFRGVQGDFYGSPTNLTLSGNTFSSSVSYGVAGTENMTGLSLTGNTFNTSNEGIGLGAGAGIASGAAVKTMRDAQTWALSGGYAIRDYRTNEVYVKGGTVSNAINHANTVAGDIIDVAAGTYNESVTVDKDVTVNGPNASAVWSGSRAAEATIDGSVFVTAAGATFAGFEVSRSTLPSLTWLMEVTGGNSTVANNLIKVGSVQSSTKPGLVVLNSSSPIAFTGNALQMATPGSFPANTGINGLLTQGTGTYTITGNRFAVSGGPSQDADAVGLTGGTVTFTGNTVNGDIMGGVTAYGNFGAVTISNNVVSNYTALAGIRAVGTSASLGTVTITNNTVGRTDSTGTAIKIDGIPASRVLSLANNDLGASAVAIHHTGTDTLSVTCNWHAAAGVAGLNLTKLGNVDIVSSLLAGTDGSTDLGFQPTGTCSGIGGCGIEGACNFTALLPFPNPADCEYTSCAGCKLTSACNYSATATIQANGQCQFLDAVGACGGSCPTDANNDDICDVTAVGCTNPTACNYNAFAGVNATNETPGTGVCNFTSCAGCTVASACNYNATATIANIASCTFAYGCDTCVNGAVVDGDSDNDGICNANEVVGCQTLGACNYNPLATEAGTCDTSTCVGCLNPLACNYSATATIAGSCTFPQAYSTCAGGCINDVNTNGICDQNEVAGCTNPAAQNYNPLADINNGSCITAPAVVVGCMFPGAPCYNAAATQQGLPILTYCVTACAAGLPAPAGMPSVASAPLTCTDWLACNYGASAACDFTSCVGCTSNNLACNYNAAATVIVPCTFTCYGCTNASACNYNASYTIENGSCEYTSCAGCTNTAACNYDSSKTLNIPASCLLATGCNTCSWAPGANPGNGTGTVVDGDTDNDGICNSAEVPGCTNSGACNYNASATNDNGSCQYTSCAGCMVSTACNYAAPGNALGITLNEPADCVYATGCDDCSWEPAANPGTGTGTVVDKDADNDGVCNAAEIVGCQNPAACNYNALATDSGTCDTTTCVGCMDATACNYSATATQPAVCTWPPAGYDDCAGLICSDINNNSTCDYLETPVLGCIDSTACDYNGLANTQDPLDVCDFLLFNGFTSVVAASGEKVADGKVTVSISGTGGDGTYVLNAIGNDSETYAIGNKVFLTTNPFGPGGGLGLVLGTATAGVDATLTYGTLLPGRYTFQVEDSSGCESVEMHSVLVPNRR
jgi:parallel beta-helix repeat protein